MSEDSVFTAAGIARLERELKIRLPERCRETLLTTTFEPEEGDIHSQDFIGDVSELIAFNEPYRDKKSRHKNCSDSWLVIGYSEEYLRYIDIAQQDAPVYLVDISVRGALAPEESAPNLAEWFVRETENQEEIERECRAFEAKLDAEERERERRRAEARKNRKWWQFWIR